MMTESIIIALITGGLTLIGVLVSNNAKQAVADEKLANTDKKITSIEKQISDLTAEVRKHNNFSTRISVAENDIETLYHDVKELKELRKLP